jgi:hypothetical protein
MFCPNCGHNVADAQGSVFCPNCGAPIEQQQQQPAPIHSQPGGGAAVKPAIGRNHIIIGGAVLIAVIAAIIVIVFVVGGNPLVGTWEHDIDWDIGIEFNRNGTGAFFEGRDLYEIEWSVETRGGREILVVDLLDSRTGRWIETVMFEFSFLRNNEVLELRNIDGWGSDRFIRIN